MNTHRVAHRVALGVALGALCLACASPARAQAPHEHAHRQAGTAVSQLQLDAGSKWPTDASLRSGMATIRKAFDVDHASIHAGKETNAQYAALAAQVESQVNGIVKDCRLPPAADANLHLVITDLLQGASLMRGQDPARSRHDGAALVHGALIAYGQYFDDPGWGG